MPIRTKGNINVDDIKIGDIHYEFEYRYGIKCQVLTLPVNDGTGYWSWESKNLNSDNIIYYGVREDMEHYGPNLYDYEAYTVKQ